MKVSSNCVYCVYCVKGMKSKTLRFCLDHGKDSNST
jgi:hypothetical protein